MGWFRSHRNRQGCLLDRRMTNCVYRQYCSIVHCNYLRPVDDPNISNQQGNHVAKVRQ